MSENIEQALDLSVEDLKLFLQEADEQIKLLDEDIVKLEKESDNMNLLQEIFRAAHTIKGSSAMIGHKKMSELAHAMEDILDKLRRKALGVSASVVDALLYGLDVLKILKQELEDGKGGSELDISGVKSQLESVAASTPSDASPKSAEKVGEVQPLAKSEEPNTDGQTSTIVMINFKGNLEWAAVRCFQAYQAVLPIGEPAKSEPSIKDIEEGKAGREIRLTFTGNVDESRLRKLLENVEDIDSIQVSCDGAAKDKPAPVPTENKAATRKDENQTVRVNVTRLDTLMEEMGELVVNRNTISQISKVLAEKYQDDELIKTLNNNVSSVGKNISTLQSDIMAIRMLPVEMVFNSLPRMVRDLARKLDKKINFVIEGQDTEVDRSVIEYLRDPMVHLLRNAVDHGIESSKERESLGKPETATVKINAYQEQDNIVITITDDGRGIDPEKVKEAAIRKKIITSQMASLLQARDIIELIFASGVSTAKQTSEVSGRGVGLDIVKTNVQAMGGTIKVDSTINKGTKFTLTLPLTLAIMPVLLITTGPATCAIPASNVVEVGELDESEIRLVQKGEALLFRNQVLPIVRLNRVFNWSADGTGPPQGNGCLWF